MSTTTTRRTTTLGRPEELALQRPQGAPAPSVHGMTTRSRAQEPAASPELRAHAIFDRTAQPVADGLDAVGAQLGGRQAASLVAIMGAPRVGKSWLASYLAGRPALFQSATGMESCTRGAAACVVEESQLARRFRKHGRDGGMWQRGKGRGKGDRVRERGREAGVCFGALHPFTLFVYFTLFDLRESSLLLFGLLAILFYTPLTYSHTSYLFIYLIILLFISLSSLLFLIQL